MARFHKRHIFYVSIVLIFIFILYKSRDEDIQRFQKYIPNLNFSQYEDPGQREMKGKFKRFGQRQTKIILLWTTHFYSQVWKGLHPSILDEYMDEAKCRIRDCVITYDKRKITTADVVVFHGVDFTYKNYTAEHFHALSSVRPRKQRWLFWMHETPIYYPELEDYDDLFNWTMTFSRQSSIYHPYYSYTRLAEDDDPPSKYTNFATGKEKKVVWMVSHCGMTRSDYAMELQKYTDVTVFGLCGASFDNMAGICSKTQSVCMKELQRYKFYLAFENSFCEDYVTEKYYKFGLMYGLVPIVMGAKYDHLNTIPGSYIDVSEFSSIEELGQYINYLDTHDDEYNKYFLWKNHFKVTDGIDKMCLICHAAHDLTHKDHVYKNFHQFWSVRNLCEPYEKDVKEKLEHQIAISKSTREKKEGSNPK